MQGEKSQCVVFDWGDTVMRNFPQFEGPMCSWPRVEAVPGIRAGLEVLGRSSILALATNAVDSDEADIRKALERCDLSEYFDRVFCFRQLGVRKPEGAFYRGVLDQLGMPPASAFMVGDDLEADVLAANTVGIRAVWFNAASTESRTGDLHRTVHDLGQLPAALRELGLFTGTRLLHS